MREIKILLKRKRSLKSLFSKEKSINFARIKVGKVGGTPNLGSVVSVTNGREACPEVNIWII